MISIELTNKAEITNLLNQLPKTYQSKTILKFMRYATAPLVDEIKRLAPVSKKPHVSKYGIINPGTMRDSVGFIVMKRAKKVTAVVGIRVKGAFGGVKNGFYAQWVEFGTKRMKARPFFRPAYDAKKDEVQERFEKDAVKTFEKEIARLTKRGKI